MKTLKIFFGAAIAVLCASCSSVQYTMTQSRSIEPVQNVMVTPVLTDLEVSQQKVVVTEKLPTKLKNLDVDLNFYIREYKGRIVSKLLAEKNADVLIGTIVAVDTDEEGYLVMTITGYPATYKNFRNATENDKWISPVLVDLTHCDGVLIDLERVEAKPIKTLVEEK